MNIYGKITQIQYSDINIMKTHSINGLTQITKFGQETQETINVTDIAILDLGSLRWFDLTNSNFICEKRFGSFRHAQHTHTIIKYYFIKYI